jgi:hypothetical protein
VEVDTANNIYDKLSSITLIAACRLETYEELSSYPDLCSNWQCFIYCGIFLSFDLTDFSKSWAL